MNNNEVANIIYNQIGYKSMLMIGAKNLVTMDDGLGFKIMRNTKGINYIEIKLNSLDLYDVRFCYVTVKGIKEIAVDNNCYTDMLRGSIEKNTGLYIRL